MPRTNKKQNRNVYKKLLIGKEVKAIISRVIKNNKSVEAFHNLCTRLPKYRSVWDAIRFGTILKVCYLLKANQSAFEELINWKAVDKIIANENHKSQEHSRKGAYVVNPKHD